jgi:hypothetical protein
MHRFSILLSLGIMACESNVTLKEPVEESDDIVVQDLDGDGYEGDEDCDDSDASINIDALEVCDGIDNNCDGAVDEDVLNTFFMDQDEDGFGSDDDVAEACEAPQGYVPNGSDCNDEDALIFPGATEVCDDIDNDCNELVDDGLGLDLYVDSDNDGFGDEDQPVDGCIEQVGTSFISGDCDDSDPAVSPDAVEVCDGIDNNCDADIDEGVGNTYYFDNDADGFGDLNSSTYECTRPDGSVENSGDCDDTDSMISPAASEVCDGGIDNNCDGLIDDSTSVNLDTFYTDADADGYGDPNALLESCLQPIGSVTNSDDCDDTDATLSPDTVWSVDIDGDGYGNVQGTCFSIFMEDAYGDGWNGGALEITLDGVLVDSGLSATGFTEQTAGRFFVPNGTELNLAFCVGDGDFEVEYFADQWESENTFSVQQGLNEVLSDGPNPNTGLLYQDTLTSTVFAQSCIAPSNAVLDSTDCDDLNADVYPGAIETCDLVDNDCNGEIDNSDSGIQYEVDDTQYLDSDGDGYGDPNASIESCVQPSGYVYDFTDCNDSDAAITPDSVWYADADADGFGGPYQTISCLAPSGYVLDSTDCNDIDGSIYPGAPEYCDSIDQDCDGDTQDANSLDALTWYLDNDGDGFGDASNSVLDCVQPTGAVDDATDCDDSDSLVFPMSHEIEVPFDGIDQDCDGFDVCKDINCDAWPDLVLASYYNNTSGYISDSYVFYGTSNGYSNLDRETLAGVGTTSSSAGDFNGDGYQDVLLTGYRNSGTHLSESVIYYGSVSGLDSVGTYVMENYGTLRSCIADLNNDGFEDIVQASHYNGSYTTTSYIYWGSVNGISDTDSTPLASQSPYDCAIDDMNQDGYLDVYFPAYAGTRESYVYWGSSSYVYDTSNRTELLYADYTLHANVEDVNLDGYPDILMGSYWSNDGAYLGSASGYSTNNFDSFNQSYIYDIAGADLNDDGLYDMVTCQYLNNSGNSYDTSSSIYWNSINGFNNNFITALETYGCRDVEITDANQDGYPDLIFISHVSGWTSNYSYTTTSYIYYGSASGYSINNRDSLQSYGSLGGRVADLNYDGYPDLILSNYLNASSDYTVDSYIYWGGPNGYGGNRTTLATVGIWDKATIVGNVE